MKPAARVVAASLLWLAAQCAWAHATLIASEPNDGARVTVAPAEAVLHFDEPVVPGTTRLLDRHGVPRTLAPPRVDGTTLRIPLPASLADGHYVLAWRVTSADAHVIGGAVAFTVGAAGAQSVEDPVPPPTDAVPHSAAQRVLRIVFLASLLAAAGGALFALLVAPLPGAAWLAGAAWLCAASAIAATWLHGVALLDPGLGPGWLTAAAEAWRAGFATSRGDSALAALAGAALLTSGVLVAAGAGGTKPRHARAARLLLLPGAILLAMSPVLTGHSATARPIAVASLAAFAHVAIAAFWFASLLLFARSGPWWRVAGGRDALEWLDRFSTFARPAVALLAIAGLVLAWLHVRDTPPAGWLVADYGRWVAVKIGALLVLVVLALLNRYRWLGAARAGNPAARRLLRVSIGFELALLFGAIGAAAWLATTPPPRPSGASSASSAARVVAETSRDGWQARVVVSPARAGSNSIELFVGPVGEPPREPQEVRIELAQAEAGVIGLERKPVPLGGGRYRWTGPEIAFAGAWEIVVRARIDDFETRELVLPVRIAP